MPIRLPEGFTLDQAEPQVPNGFTLDEPKMPGRRQWEGLPMDQVPQYRDASFIENAKTRGANLLTQIPAAIAQGISAPLDLMAMRNPSVAAERSASGNYMPLTESIGSMQRDAAGSIARSAGVPKEAITDVAGAQGQIMGDVAAAPVARAGMSAPGIVTKPVRKVLSERAAPRLMNSLLKPTDNMQGFGAQPAEGAIGIMSGTKRGMFDKIETAIKQTDDQLTRVLKSPAAQQQKVDILAVMKDPIEEAIDAATRTGNEAAISRITQLAQAQIDDAMKVSGGQRFVTPEQAHALKKRTNDLISNWKEDTSDTTTLGVLQEIYRAYDGAIDTAVPAAKGLNKRMANQITAKRAIEKRIKTDQRSDIDMDLNPFKWLSNLVNTTAVKSGLAKGFRALGE